MKTFGDQHHCDIDIDSLRLARLDIDWDIDIDCDIYCEVEIDSHFYCIEFGQQSMRKSKCEKTIERHYLCTAAPL